ncbi:MAG: hypothetical protein VKJ46_16965, partial [Leptolyngbyaceae bacterium]|nr:hypothetical protein [Leptolyngbyaceae bacterium]
MADPTIPAGPLNPPMLGDFEFSGSPQHWGARGANPATPFLPGAANHGKGRPIVGMGEIATLQIGYV